MAQKKVKGNEVKVTLNREGLKKRSLKNLQNISTQLNLSLGNRTFEFSREQLIDNLLEYADLARKAELKRIQNAARGIKTEAEIKAMTVGELIVCVEGLGFAPAPTATVSALQDTVRTYKGEGAVMTPPSERNEKEKGLEVKPVKLSDLGIESKFRYPTSKTEYMVTEIGEACTKIINVESNKCWTLKSEKEINREVVPV